MILTDYEIRLLDPAVSMAEAPFDHIPGSMLAGAASRKWDGFADAVAKGGLSFGPGYPVDIRYGNHITLHESIPTPLHLLALQEHRSLGEFEVWKAGSQPKQEAVGQVPYPFLSPAGAVWRAVVPGMESQTVPGRSGQADQTLQVISEFEVFRGTICSPDEGVADQVESALSGRIRIGDRQSGGFGLANVLCTRRTTYTMQVETQTVFAETPLLVRRKDGVADGSPEALLDTLGLPYGVLDRAYANAIPMGDADSAIDKGSVFFFNKTMVLEPEERYVGVGERTHEGLGRLFMVPGMMPVRVATPDPARARALLRYAALS